MNVNIEIKDNKAAASVGGIINSANAAKFG